MSVSIYNDNGDFREVAFKGKWLIEDERDDTYCETAGVMYSVAISAKAKYFVKIDKYGCREFHDYQVYDSFEEMIQKDEVPPGILRLVAEGIGIEYEEFWDI